MLGKLKHQMNIYIFQLNAIFFSREIYINLYLDELIYLAPKKWELKIWLKKLRVHV